MTKASDDWKKENTVWIGLRLNKHTDADLIQALEGKAKQTEIKRLLRLALSHSKESK